MAVHQNEWEHTPILSKTMANMVHSKLTIHHRNNKDCNVENFSNAHQGWVVQPPARQQQGIEPLEPSPRMIVILPEVEAVVLVELIIQIGGSNKSSDYPCQVWASDTPDIVIVRQRPTSGILANTQDTTRMTPSADG
jgi:hypothetical protein